MTHLLVKGGNLLSMDPDVGDLPIGDVRIIDGRIAAVGTDLEPAGAEVIDAAGAIVMPGLVDGHRHAWQTILRGAATDWTLPEYMVKMRTMYAGCFDAEAAYISNYLGGIESLAAGITTVVDHSHLQKSEEVTDALARGLLDSGIGGVFCYALQNVPDFINSDSIETDSVRDLVTRSPDIWHDANAQRVRDKFFQNPHQPLHFGLAMPEGAPYLPLAALRSLLDRATKLAPFLVTGHWDVGEGEPVIRELSLAGGWPARTVLSHCNHLHDDDLAALANAGVGISTSPDAECGSGVGPLTAFRFLEHGGASSVGIDTTASGRADLLQQAHLLLQIERLVRASKGLPTVASWTAQDALELVTLTGAKSVGLGSEVGSLTVGKRGDVIVVRPDVLSAEPVGNAAATLLFYTSPSDVETVIVAGNVVKRHGAMVGIDVAELGDRAAVAAARVHARYRALPRVALEQVWVGMFG